MLAEAHAVIRIGNFARHPAYPGLMISAQAPDAAPATAPPRARRRRRLRRLLLLGLGTALAGAATTAGAALYTHRGPVAEGRVTLQDVADEAGLSKAASSGHVFAATAAPAELVALVLGAQVHPNGSPSPYLKAQLDLAKQLYDDGRARAILVSGDNGTHRYNEPDAMRRYLIAVGVPQCQVAADYAGFDTYASCRRTDRVFGGRELIVVTQTYHLPRAVTTCRALGLDASGVGDESVRANTEVWRNGQVHELAANQKLVLELLRHREPLLGPHESGIDEALH